MIVNKRQLSEILGILERFLTEWQKEGLSVVSYTDHRGQANEYDSISVIKWLIQREVAKVCKEKPRDRLDLLKADAIELDIKERTGELAPTTLFEQAWGNHILAARTEFLTMPDVLATELSAIVGKEVDPDIIASYINKALEKLANYGIEDDEDHAGAGG